MEKISLIGMYDVKRELEELIKYKDVYQKANVNIPHFIIMLDSGNGQTCITEAITDILANYALREFHGIDEYLEYKPDGTLTNIKWMFADMDDNAIYDNGYKGVVAIDITKMARVQNEYQMKYFEEQLAKVAETATIILFCATTLGKKGETLVRRLSNVLEKVRIIECEKYTSRDLAEIIVQNVVARGIVVTDEEKVLKVLEEIMLRNEVKVVKDAIAMVEKLVFYADYSNTIPVLDFRKTKSFKKIICEEV